MIWSLVPDISLVELRARYPQFALTIPHIIIFHHTIRYSGNCIGWKLASLAGYVQIFQKFSKRHGRFEINIR